MIIKTLKEFSKLIKFDQPVIGIDYGLKKTGLAISSLDHQVSLPLYLIKNHSERDKINFLIQMIQDQNVCAIVIGLPLNMDATESSQTIIVKKFANKLVTKTKLPVFLQDERITSKAANSLLKSYNIKRKMRNSIDDLVSASMILETILKSKKFFV